jgi:tRNA (guanine-N7-)-methyltransferase
MRLRRKPWIDEAILEVKGRTLFCEQLEQYKGHWQEIFPGKRICLEIGSGKGRFIMGMGRLHPEKAFIGVETQRDVAYYPAKAALEEGLTNVKIIWGDACQLEDWFEPGEVKELYLNFSDPWPKARHAKRRLTHRSFLERYQKLLGPGGHLRFKTDNRGLFDFSVAEFQNLGLKIAGLSYDLHHSSYLNEVQTEYEEKFSAQGHPINFCEVIF